jgi:hypothetical protein
MNQLGIVTLVAYFALAGAAFSYGYVNSRGMDYSEPAARQSRTALPESEAGRGDGPAGAPRKPKSTPAKPSEKPAGKPYIPLDEPAQVDLVYGGVDSSGASFTLRSSWGQWHQAEETYTASRSKAGGGQVDLQWGRIEVTPQFGAGRRGAYDVKLFTNGRGLVGRFSIVDSGKQAKLAQVSTPGLLQELVFYDPERRVTTYRVVTAGRNQRKEVCGIVFIGKGWSAVEETKTTNAEATFLFPETQILVLPEAWMDGNDIGDVMQTFKRGTSVGRTAIGGMTD